MGAGLTSGRRRPAGPRGRRQTRGTARPPAAAAPWPVERVPSRRDSAAHADLGQRPRLSSCSTATRDCSDTPSPSRTASLIAPFEPSVRVWGQVVVGEELRHGWRVPEPLSRISHPAGELLGANGAVAGEVVVGSRDQRDLVHEERLPAIRSSSGRPAIATSTSCSSTRSKARLGWRPRAEVDLGIRGPNGQQRRHHELRRRRDRDDPQRPHRDPPPPARPFSPARSARARRPYGRKASPAAVSPTPQPTLGQVDAQLARQCRDRRRDRGLPDQLLGRRRHRSLARDGEKALQLIQRHGHNAETIEHQGLFDWQLCAPRGSFRRLSVI